MITEILKDVLTLVGGLFLMAASTSLVFLFL